MAILHRRAFLGALATAPFWTHSSVLAQTPRRIKIAHQFPGATLTEGDFRDRICRMFGAEVEKRTQGALKFEIYPGSSLMKTNAQFSSMRKGGLDMSLLPLSYAGGEVPELNICTMPGIVISYEQACGWKTRDIGRELTRILEQKGVVLVSWVWQAGGMAARGKAVVDPEDARGLKIRGGSREMDMILKAAGATVLTMPSNEIYAGMQTGAMDAAMTASTSLMSFRMDEVSKALTTARTGTYWFTLEPLMMSKPLFDQLPKEHRDIVMAVGGELESFALRAARADDAAAGSLFQKAGAKVVDLDAHSLRRWVALARATAWKDYGDKSEGCARLLAMAEKAL
jgi:TRAP-type C4-dicarboxylate transport system substrate-binding protein